MSTTATRTPLSEAAPLAAELLDLLGPACERLVVAGSIRRRRPDIGDIELLAIPRVENTALRDLFGAPLADVTEMVNHLDDLALDLKRDGVLADRLDVNGRGAWGSKFKRMLFRGVGVDLFVTSPDRFGLALVIRTGPSAFSNAFVTQTHKYTREGYRGLCPAWAVVRDGFQFCHAATGEVIPTPTEEEVFALWKLDWIDPRDRDERVLARVR